MNLSLSKYPLNNSSFYLLGDSRGQLYLLYVPLNPFTQSSKQDPDYVHGKLENSKDESNINGDNKHENENKSVYVNGDEKSKIEEKEKEENENHDHTVIKKGKKNVQLNPFHYLSSIFKYVFGRSDIFTKFKTLPTIRIAGTMDLLDSTLEDQGRTNKK